MTFSNAESEHEIRKITLRDQIVEDVASVFERDPAARNQFEVLLTYPGVHAIIWHRIANRMWRANWRFSARILSFLSRTWSNIDIHPGATVGRRFFIDHGAGVVIGETAEIGNDVTLYHGVTLGGTSWSKGKRHPTLEDGVMVGAGAKILGPIVIGNKARVGANSVVIADVPAGQTVVGIPGKLVQLKKAGDLNPHGIDLNHHLIPDPVGRAISCLVNRIGEMEVRLQRLQGEIQTQHFCHQCEAELLCDSHANSSDGVHAQPDQENRQSTDKYVQGMGGIAGT